VNPIGWFIRNATPAGFPQGKLVKKRKKNQKRKRKRSVENAAAMEIRKTIGGLRRNFLDADSPQLLGKASLNRSAFPHLPQTRRRRINMENNFHP